MTEKKKKGSQRSRKKRKRDGRKKGKIERKSCKSDERHAERVGQRQ